MKTIKFLKGLYLFLTERKDGLTMTDVKELKSIEEWNQLKKDSLSKSELVILKYSPYCSISAFAEDNFDRWASSLNESPELEIIKVNVINARSVSQQIAKDLNIVHESPQLLWLNREMKVKWNATHYNITKSSLDNAIKME
ncbi:MAG: bacillithiol system redox-active protein YtxJ [Ignavibacteriaceae bacterium]